MSSHAEGSHDASHHHDDSHSPAHYVKIWAVLLVLLGVSLAGPEIGIRWVTLITAFGIAVVKAFLVIKHFMHLTVERKVAQYAIGACFMLMLLFFFAVAPDVMKHWGVNWHNEAASNMKREIERSEHHAPAADQAHAPADGAGHPEASAPAAATH